VRVQRLARAERGSMGQIAPRGGLRPLARGGLQVGLLLGCYLLAAGSLWSQPLPLLTVPPAQGTMTAPRWLETTPWDGGRPPERLEIVETLPDGQVLVGLGLSLFVMGPDLRLRPWSREASELAGGDVGAGADVEEVAGAPGDVDPEASGGADAALVLDAALVAEVTRLSSVPEGIRLPQASAEVVGMLRSAHAPLGQVASAGRERSRRAGSFAHQGMGPRFLFVTNALCRRGEGSEVLPCAGAEVVQAPQLLRWSAAVGRAELVALPEGCEPLRVGGAGGLAVLFCAADAGERPQVWVRGEAEWRREGTLGAPLVHGRLRVGPDGTLLLTRRCGRMGRSADEACEVALRQPFAAGSEGAWWSFAGMGPGEFLVLDGGRALWWQRDAEEGRRGLWLLSAAGLQALREDFSVDEALATLRYDPEGCLVGRLVDAADGAERVLGFHGEVTRWGTCAEARAAAVLTRAAAGAASAWEGLEPERDERVALRLAGTGYMADGVQAWSGRAELSFPIYGGRYEAAGVMRVGMGSRLSYAGGLLLRWLHQSDAISWGAGGGVAFGELCANDAAGRKAGCAQLALRYWTSGTLTWTLTDALALFLVLDVFPTGGWSADLGLGLAYRFF